jgi:integrase
MGSVKRRPNGKYRARYRDVAGKEHARHFVRKVDADKWVALQQASVVKGDWIDPARTRMTVGQMAAVWLQSKADLKSTGRRDYDSVWRSRVKPRWNDVPVASVSYADAIAWKAAMAAEIGPHRVAKALLVLKQILDFAVDDGRLVKNPIKRIKPPKLHTGEQRFLTHAELFRLAIECGKTQDQYRVMVLLVGYTGLRFGEVAALRVRRLDLDKARLEIAENAPDNGGVIELVPPKSHKRRTVPFPRFLIDDLRKLIAIKAGKDFVFTSQRGHILRNQNFRDHVFDAAVERAGLAPFTPHNLRDTAASLAVSAGANVKAVQRMLGHFSAALTLDIYAGLFSDDLDAVAERLDEIARHHVADYLRTGEEAS